MYNFFSYKSYVDRANFKINIYSQKFSSLLIFPWNKDYVVVPRTD